MKRTSSTGSVEEPGGPPGLQIRWTVLDKRSMGSTPIRFRQETMARHDRQPRPRRRISRRQRLILATTTAVVVAVGVGYFAYRAAANLPGVAMPDQGNLHIAAADAPHEAYNSDPPTSRPHLPYIPPRGPTTRPVPPPLQVHNLEDGGVLIQYNCECPDLVERLRAIVRRSDRHVVLAAYPPLKSRIARNAWARGHAFEELGEQRIARRVEAYRGIDHHK